MIWDAGRASVVARLRQPSPVRAVKLSRTRCPLECVQLLPHLAIWRSGVMAGLMLRRLFALAVCDPRMLVALDTEAKVYNAADFSLIVRMTTQSNPLGLCDLCPTTGVLRAAARAASRVMCSVEVAVPAGAAGTVLVLGEGVGKATVHFDSGATVGSVPQPTTAARGAP